MMGERYMHCNGKRKIRCRSINTETKHQCGNPCRMYVCGIALCVRHGKQVREGMRETPYVDVQ